jgi:hypothetical protein
MIYTSLALSLTNTFTKVGAIAAFVGLFGIAILALLVFTQAREIKRLREWAGRAPERAIELEQRVSTQAATRTAAVGAARPVPRATPLNVRASAASGPATRVASGIPVPATAQPLSTDSPPSPPQTPNPQPQAANGQATAPAAVPAQGEQAAPKPDSPAAEPQAQTSTGAPQIDEQQRTPPVEPTATPTGDGPKPDPAQQPAAATGAEERPSTESSGVPPSVPAPATAAARAARSPLPPAVVPTGDRPQEPDIKEPSPGPIRATTGAPPRRPPAPPAGAPTGARRTASDQPSVQRPLPRPDSYKYLTDEERRAPARTTALVLLGVVLVGVLAVILITTLGKGGSSSPPTTGTQANAVTTTHTTSVHHHGTTKSLSNPATVSVSVLNGTETTGLAHDLAASLKEHGYTRAVPLDGHPPGTYPKTVVEYTNGHSADAHNIAKQLGIASSEVQQMDPATAPLTNGAVVVVVAGVDESTKASNAGETTAVPNTGASASGSEENAAGG